MTVAVLPIKRFSAAKQRLERGDRGTLMRGMVAGVLEALRTSSVERVLVVTSDADAAALARGFDAEIVDEGELRGHSGAAMLGVARAQELGARRVLLIAGDCPLMTADAIDDLLSAHVEPGVVVLCDRHGSGTNGLLLEPPDAIEPGFGPGSRDRHEQRARDSGAACVVDERPAFQYDVDTVEDLAAVDHLRAA